jgi:uncharacterized protein YdcH (DUF465 family)
MASEEDNSIESFEMCGFRTDQAEHLSRLSNAMDAMIKRKQSPCSESMFEHYKQQASELKDEIDYYWAKYQEENR